MSIKQTDRNNFDIVLAKETVHIGHPSVTSSFLPVTNKPRWGECNIGMQMVGDHALFGSSSLVSPNVIRSTNSYLQLDQSSVGLNPGYNEFGGLDHTITVLQPLPGNAHSLSYALNLTNCIGYVQPPLTSEWKVGRILPGGNTVASVTATDVVDNKGRMVVHRPPQTVNSVVFYHSTKGGIVIADDAARGLTTGQMGILYSMKATDSSPVPQVTSAGWSLLGHTLTLNWAFPKSPVYPIVIAPYGDTFGYTTIAGTLFGLSTGDIYQSILYAGLSEVATSMSFYGYTVGGTAAMALYSGTTGQTYVANTAAFTPTSSGAWQTANFTSNPTCSSSTNYGLCIAASISADTGCYYNAGAATYLLYYAEAYGTWPGTMPASAQYGQYYFSIYVTCTATATTPTNWQIMITQ
jgi:hypothetical protein